MTPFQHKSFEKRGCPEAFFVSKLWPFEVGICKIWVLFMCQIYMGLNSSAIFIRGGKKNKKTLVRFDRIWILPSTILWCHFYTLDCAFCLMNLWAKFCIVCTQFPNYFSHHFFPPRAPLRAAGWVEEQGGGLHLPPRPSRCFVARTKSY